MEAPPTTVDTAPVTGGVAPTRGRGGQMRGSYERGRGRGMGRGHFSGIPGGYPPRGGYIPRGGMGGPPMGYPSRGGYIPRGVPPMRGGPGIGGPGSYQGRGGLPRGGPPIRGTGRMPLYTQPPKQHTGVDNNKTVSPVQAAVANQVVTGTEENDANSVSTAPVTNSDPNAAGAVATVAAPIAAKPLPTGVSPNYRGTGRGRGIGGPRGGGRGAYNPHNGTVGMTSMYSPQIGEHGVMRRGGPPRGRGQYANGGMTRPPLMQQQPHIVNTQVTQQTSLKRGTPGGPPGPKRGRYDGGPYSQRAPAPKYHQPHMAPHASYAVQHQPAQAAPHSHHSYVQHDPSQTMDPYAQSYATPQTQAPYNGYAQTSAYSHAAPTHTAQQTSASYSTHAATEYDQSQYQGYSSAYTQPDTRYQTYGQDYTQQYGAPAVDYSTSQADYTQHTQQSYDERAYAGYDTQSYQQSYSNSTGYY